MTKLSAYAALAVLSAACALWATRAVDGWWLAAALLLGALGNAIQWRAQDVTVSQLISAVCGGIGALSLVLYAFADNLSSVAQSVVGAASVIGLFALMVLSYINRGASQPVNVAR